MNDRVVKAGIETLIEEIEALPESAPNQFYPPDNKRRIDQIINEIRESFGKLFDYDSWYYNDVGNLPLKSQNADATIGGQVDRYWKADIKTIKEFLNSILEDRGLNAPTVKPSQIDAGIDKPKRDLNRVFIVHGHDQEMKEAVARVISKLKLEPIILHEQADENKTIIEKFEKHSNVDFAVILLSPDDFAYKSGKSPVEGKYRARQNVILELGFFLAKLDRKGVFILYRENNNFEFPSDYLGVLYTPYDNYGNWKNKMADEMKKIDPKIDKNLL